MRGGWGRRGSCALVHSPRNDGEGQRETEETASQKRPPVGIAACVNANSNSHEGENNCCGVHAALRTGKARTRLSITVRASSNDLATNTFGVNARARSMNAF